jgi:nucleoside-diphosphate-sugar epimerase
MLGQNAEFYVPDTGRARIELGLNQEFLLFEGIQKTIAWNKWNLQPGVYDSLEVPTSHF